MDGFGSRSLINSFVSEKDLEEQRKKDEESGKPRKPVQIVDNRSLYEKLQEQKNKKQADYEEQHKFKNQIRGLDEEEADFLSYVSEKQTEIEQERKREEQELLNELKVFQKTNQTKNPSLSDKLKINLPPTKILPGSAKRKRSPEEEKKEVKKSKTSETSGESFVMMSHDDQPSSSASLSSQKCSDAAKSSSTAKPIEKAQHANGVVESTAGSKSSAIDKNSHGDKRAEGFVKVIGLLPGIGPYDDHSSDSSSSSSESDVDIDLMCSKKSISAKQIQKLIGQ